MKKGHKMSEEHKRKIGLANKGHKVSEETKKKISKTKKGNSPAPNKDVPCSKETKEKISKAKRGCKSWSKGMKFIYKPHFKQRGFIPKNKGKKSPQTSGEKNYNWKGGITPINQQIRQSLEYKKWRRMVFERDNWTCIWCKKRNGSGYRVILNVDHIIPFSKIIEKLKFEQGIDNLCEKAIKYGLLWDINNGRTLCVDCHKTTFGKK